MTQFLTLTPHPAQDLQTLQTVWRDLNAESCPHHYNFHLHSRSSDGQLLAEDLMAQAVRIGLKGMALTDHHTIEGYHRAQAWLTAQALPHAPQLWTGVEITTQVYDTDVHILGYGFDPAGGAIAPYLTGESPTGAMAQGPMVIDAIHRSGGLAVLAHPERYRRPAAELIPILAQWGIDGAETYYSYRKANPWQPSPVETAQVKALAEQFNLFQTCGTDTHGVDLLLRL